MWPLIFLNLPSFPQTLQMLAKMFFPLPSLCWPGGNHAYSRAFSAYFPRIFRARGECAENARRIRGEYAENARRIRVSATRTFRVLSAHSPHIFRARGECAENTRRMRVSARDFPQALLRSKIRLIVLLSPSHQNFTFFLSRPSVCCQ